MRNSNCSKYIRPFYEWFKDKLYKEKIIDLTSIGIPEDEYVVFDIVVDNYFNNNEIYRISKNIVIFRPEHERLLEEIETLASDRKIIDIKEIPFSPGFSKKLELYEDILINNMGMVKLKQNQYFYARGKLTNEEEIYLIIHQAGIPLHYEDVPQMAKKLNMPLNTKPGRNTLATMQRDNLLRRMAPGTYGLKEWGIPKHIYIKDLIYKILENASRPLYYNEILEEVKQRRLDEIKERSVEYYLATHEEVMYIYTRQYILSEWVETADELVRYGVDIKKIQDKILL